MKQAVTLAKFEFFKQRKTVLIWMCAVFGIMSLYTVLFPSIQDLAQAKFDVLPKELLQFVGMDGFSDMTHYNKYFFIIYSIVLIVISIFAATYPSKLILEEERKGTIEYLYSHPISRKVIYQVKAGVAVVSLFLLLLAGLLPGIINGTFVGGDTFNLMEMIRVWLALSLIPMFFLSLSLGVAGGFPKLSGLSVASVLLMYVLGYLSKLMDSSFLMYISPFEVFSANNLIMMPSNVFVSYLVYLGIVVVFLISGCVIYQKRDYSN